MNKKYKDIANQYEISEEQSHEILAGLKIDNISKNPSKLKLQAFESVCKLLKEGKDLGGAISQVEEEVKQLGKETDRTDEILDTVTSEAATQAVDAIYESTMNTAQSIYHQVNQTIKTKIVVGIAQKFLQKDFQSKFSDFVNLDIERNQQGKLTAIEDLESLIAGNSEQSVLPPGQ